MLNLASAETRLHDAFREDVLRGLSKTRKSIPCRWLYDERGSDLFERITLLPDYYPARTETRILRENAADIARFAHNTQAILEYGAGSGTKTEILLAAIAPPFYVPIDICRSSLEQATKRLRRLFPGIETHPLVADFAEEFALPQALLNRMCKTVFFPGSTLGNLSTSQASRLLRRMRVRTGPWGRAVIGIDLRKDPRRLIRAYDDSAGVTAAFNLNLLERMNRELGADFHADDFDHEARWNEAESAVEMHLVSRSDQDVAIGDRLFSFRAQETIHTESSRKYDIDGFVALGQTNGWRAAQVWQDADRDFAVFGLAAC